MPRGVTPQQVVSIVLSKIGKAPLQQSTKLVGLGLPVAIRFGGIGVIIPAVAGVLTGKFPLEQVAKNYLNSVVGDITSVAATQLGVSIPALGGLSLADLANPERTLKNIVKGAETQIGQYLSEGLAGVAEGVTSNLEDLVSGIGTGFTKNPISLDLDEALGVSSIIDSLSDTPANPLLDTSSLKTEIGGISSIVNAFKGHTNRIAGIEGLSPTSNDTAIDTTIVKTTLSQINMMKTMITDVYNVAAEAEGTPIDQLTNYTQEGLAETDSYLRNLTGGALKLNSSVDDIVGSLNGKESADLKDVEDRIFAALNNPLTTQTEIDKLTGELSAAKAAMTAKQSAEEGFVRQQTKGVALLTNLVDISADKDDPALSDYMARILNPAKTGLLDTTNQLKQFSETVVFGYNTGDISGS